MFRRLVTLTTIAMAPVFGLTAGGLTPATADTPVACTVPALIAALSGAGSGVTLDLSAGCVYDLTMVNNGPVLGTADGAPNGLPVIAAAVVIHGNGATIQRDSSVPAFRLFYVSAGGSLSLDNLTLQNGLAQGDAGESVSGGNFGGAGGKYSGLGGAIYAAGNLTLSAVTLNNNQAVGGAGGNVNNGAGGGSGGGGGGLGGAIYVAGGATTISASTLSGNQATGGAGGSQSDFGGITIGGGGGGLGGKGGDQPGGTGAAGGGFAGGGGGSGAFGSGANGGFAGGGGAGGGNGGFGGGNGSGIPSNSGGGGGAGLGGGIYLHAGTLSLSTSTLAGNKATGGIGGSGFSGAGNGGSGEGGGIFAEGGSVSITSSTLSGNQALGGIGGGSQISGMGGPGGALGGGIATDNGAVAVANSILAGILAGSTGGVCGRAGAGSFTDNDYNLAYPDATGCGFTASHDIIGADPQLNPLGNNGGPTLTMAMANGSPAIDKIPAASCGGSSDQRGSTRPDDVEDHCDIGAYESAYQPDLAVSGNGPLSGTEGTALTATVGSFSDPDLGGPDHGVSITWGDGVTDSCTATGPGACSFSTSASPPAGVAGAVQLYACDSATAPTTCKAQGTHTYAEESESGAPYTVTLSVTDSDQTSPVTGQSTVNIADAALTPGPATNTLTNAGNPSGTCSQAVACSGVVATFTDASSTCTGEGEAVSATTGAPHYAISIDWGDGSTTASTSVSQTNCGFSISGSHAYAMPGSAYPVKVTVTDEGCADNSPANSGGCSITVQSSVTVNAVNDLAVTGNQTVNGSEGAAVTVTVGSFTDADNTVGKDFALSIAWGDGVTDSCLATGLGACGYSTSTTPPAGSPGSIQLYHCDSATTPTSCLVQGTHTYAGDGRFPIGITVTDSDQSTQPPAAGSTAVISPGPDDSTLTAGSTWTATEGTSHTQLIGHWSDADAGTPEPADAELAVAWPDGAIDYCTVYTSTLPSCFSPSSALQLVNCTGGQTSCDVQGTHTTTEESEPGGSPISLFVTDPDQSSPTLLAGIPVRVSDAALAAGSAVLTLANGSNPAGSCSQGISCSGIITSFGDSNPACTGEGEGIDPTTGAPHYAISVNWGDGSAPTAPTAVSSTGSCGYSISGNHSYATPGSKSITVTITDEGCADNAPVNSGGCSLTLFAGVIVVATNDAGITGARQVTGVEDAMVTGTLGSISDADNTGAPDWSITVGWGDGTAPDICTPTGQAACTYTTSATPPAGSAGTIQLYACDSASAPTHCLVQGTHTYAAESSHAISLSLADADQTAQPGAAASGAVISPGPDDSTLSAGSTWTAVEGASHTQVLGHWSDTDGGAPEPADAVFAAAWPDGHIDSCSTYASTLPSCFSPSSALQLVNCNTAHTSCDAQGTHTTIEETEPGGSAISLFVTDSDQSSPTLLAGIPSRVSDAALTAGSAALTISNNSNPAGTCSQALTCSGIITSFVDSTPACTAEGEGIDATSGAPHYLVSINWGDGSALTAPAAVTATGSCGYAISGSHSYGIAGSKSITVTITDEGCADNAPANSGGCSLTLAAGVMVTTVNDAAVTGTRQLTGTESTPVTGTVGSMSDPDNSGSPDWSITINWGDATTPDTCTVAGLTACTYTTGATPPAGSPGTIQLYACDSASAPTHCLVQGTHAYAAEGSYAISLSLADADQTAQPGAAASSAVISPGPDDSTLSPGSTWMATEGAAHTQIIGHWGDVDGGTPEPPDTVFAAAWPDGHIDSCSTAAGSQPSCFSPSSALQLVNCNAAHTSCDVQGTHTTFEESEPGGSPIALFATDPDQASPTLLLGIPASISDAPLTATGANALTGSSNTPCSQFAPCSGLVGSFTDTNPSCTSEGEGIDLTTGAPHYAISINWGDGSAASTPTSVSQTAPCSYAVSGSHSYAAPGTYAVTVTITDEGCADGGTSCSITIGGPGSSITNKVTISTPASSSNLTGHTSISASAATPGPSFAIRAANNTTPPALTGMLFYQDNSIPFFINAFGASGAALPPGMNSSPTWCSSQSGPGCMLTIDAIQCTSAVATVYGHYTTVASGQTYYFRVQVTGATTTGPGSFQLTTNSPVGMIVTPTLTAVAGIAC